MRAPTLILGFRLAACLLPISLADTILMGPCVNGLFAAEPTRVADVAEGRVLLTFHEGMPTHTRWLNATEEEPPEATRWGVDRFLIRRIPLHFDDWGIRDGWKAPMLVRMSADVRFVPGKNHLLLRARGISRLWVDGKLVAETQPITKQPPNGEEPITPLAEPPLPGHRVVGYHQQEVMAEFHADASSSEPVRVVLEMIVGGKNLRTETGEICIAVQAPGAEGFHVLQPTSATSATNNDVPLTDEAILPEMKRIDAALAEFDDRTRRQAAASQDAFWDGRHEYARSWTNTTTSGPGIKETGDGHPVDGFVVRNIFEAERRRLTIDAKTSEFFHGKLLPILRDNCFRCHGEKEKGGLRLSSRELAIRGGDSGAAIVPGDVDASELVARIRADDEDVRMPPTGDALNAEEVAIVEQWIKSGAFWPPAPIDDELLRQPPIVDDATFVRRAFLDTVGVPPTAEETTEFLDDPSDEKRSRIIDRLLNDERSADHWMSFWLDLLAENPTLLNASLNSTGPFRWFLFDSLRDNKPLDRMVTELILMRGGQHEGGSAGFGMAAENDAPFAAKSHILASAFLGIELQCARCHDSPYHATTQQDLYSLAAMLERKPTSVPETSRVPAAFFDEKQRDSLIEVTLNPGQAVSAVWPFADVTGVDVSPELDRLMLQPNDSREQLAALITSPQNQRFSRVIVNRIWKRLIGAGIVEPIHDWEGQTPSHPQMLDWLARELVLHDYDARHVVRLIMTSQTYQRESTGRNTTATAEQRFFAAPERRRLSAEQIVDSLFAVTGNEMDVEELTFVHDGRRAISNRLTLGRPTRAWMFASLNNERDRPSLALPKARAVADVLEAFGWNGSRQKPIVDRDIEPNVLQAGVMANGTLTSTLSRAAQGSHLARLALDAKSPEDLVDAVFLQTLSRRPREEERAEFTSALTEGFDRRIVPENETQRPSPLPPLRLVTWFNHLRPDANTIQQEVERRIRQGPPPDPRLRDQWREVYEDFVWSLINHREFVWMP